MTRISTAAEIEAAFPGYYNAEADRASELDRVFFEQNPSRSYRLRPTRSGELPSLLTLRDGWAYVAVKQLRPGVRLRISVAFPEPRPDTEELARAVFAVMRPDRDL